eukprot:TRINITY_DN31257_c0_g1_i1.p1 TRINITY_DN31257_c0_g1~~TRINITY_DN31257_c0_g1_i1.p1  ORF type:complete len:343 (-),score=64.97 TRINITY_DN31257_c0_g1_i1:215-1243(-)
MMSRVPFKNLANPRRLTCFASRKFSSESSSVFRKLHDGVEIPALGLGTWKATPDVVIEALTHAIKIGYRHIDGAAVYRNEVEVGKGIASGLAAAGLRRDKLFVTSKLWNTEHRPERVRNACIKTLQDLNLSYLDLYLMHWPVAFDPSSGAPYPPRADGSPWCVEEDVPLWETFAAMKKLVDEGLVRSVGVSNFSIRQLEDLARHLDFVPAVNQVECHPYFRQEEMREFCGPKGIQVVAYSPLGSPGVEYPGDPPKPALLSDSTVARIAEKNGKSPAQVLLRWSIQSGLCVIPKSSSAKRLEENFAVLSFALSSEDMSALNALPFNIRFLNPLWCPFRKQPQP